MTDTPYLKKTPLHSRHVALGAKMVAFAGFDMPVQYTGIIEEHMAVRRDAGLCDVSHMGEVLVTGNHAYDFVQNLVSNDVSTLCDGRALYCVMCNADGGAVDDLLVYRLAQNRYLLVINASNIDGDITWMNERNEVGAQIEDLSNKTGLLALQGPKSLDVLMKASGFDARDLKSFHFARPTPDQFLGINNVLVSRTGYTGEIGVEIYCRQNEIGAVWDALMLSGKDFGLKPVGLGARDTLRLESGFCLYGNELSLDINPLEAGLGWVTKLTSNDFVGRSRLSEINETGPPTKLVGFIADERGIPRSGYEIQNEAGSAIGNVTSGTQSPVLRKGIGLGYVSNDILYTSEGAKLYISARGRRFGVTVKKPPFHK